MLRGPLAWRNISHRAIRARGAACLPPWCADTAGSRRPASPRLILGLYQAHDADAALFHTDWPEALLDTADGGGARLYYSARLLRNGRLTKLSAVRRRADCR